MCAKVFTKRKKTEKNTCTFLLSVLYNQLKRIRYCCQGFFSSFILIVLNFCEVAEKIMSVFAKCRRELERLDKAKIFLERKACQDLI